MDTKTNARPRQITPTRLALQTALFLACLAAAILMVTSDLTYAGACWGFTTGIAYTYAVKAWMQWVIR